MKFTKWANKKVKKMDWLDVKLIKLSTAAFVLLVAKLWPPLLSLDWKSYVIIAVVTAIRPLKRVFG